MLAVNGRQAGSSAAATEAVPHSGDASRSLYRENPAASKIGNMMYDRRVARGSTVAQPVVAPSVKAEQERMASADEERRKRKLAESRKRADAEAAARALEVPPVAGRAHNAIQTETYLETLSDRAPEEEAGVQTEAAMNRPPAPLFVPAPSGVDAVTQIAPGDLFDFDFEVQPLLDVLVGRTLEQALAEVAQERELAAIRARREEFEAVRGAELAEVQRMEMEVKRRFAERQRRKEQEAARAARETAVREKVAAAAFSRSYLSAMRRNVFASLHASGHFYDPLKRDINAWLPSIFAEVAGTSGGARAVAETLVDSLLADALSLGGRKFAGLLREKAEAEEARLKAAADAEAEKARKRAEEEAAAAAAAAAEAAAGEGGEQPAAEE